MQYCYVEEFVCSWESLFACYYQLIIQWSKERKIIQTSKSNHNDKTWMCVIFLIYSDPSANLNKNMITLQKTNSCLLENNGKVLGNDEADVNNQMSRKCKEENIMSYLERFNSLVALIPTLRAGFSVLMYKAEFSVCDLSVSWNSWTHVRPSLKSTVTRFIWSSQTGRRKLRPGLLRRTTKKPDRSSGYDNDRNEDDLKSDTEEVSVNNW